MRRRYIILIHISPYCLQRGNVCFGGVHRAVHRAILPVPFSHNRWVPQLDAIHFPQAYYAKDNQIGRGGRYDDKHWLMYT